MRWTLVILTSGLCGGEGVLANGAHGKVYRWASQYLWASPSGAHPILIWHYQISDINLKYILSEELKNI